MQLGLVVVLESKRRKRLKVNIKKNLLNKLHLITAKKHLSSGQKPRNDSKSNEKKAYKDWMSGWLGSWQSKCLKTNAQGGLIILIKGLTERL